MARERLGRVQRIYGIKKNLIISRITNSKGMTIKNIGNYNYIINNKYQFKLYQDGYTVEDINFIELQDDKYIIEDNLKPFLLDINQKIGRRTEKKAFNIINHHQALFNN